MHALIFEGLCPGLALGSEWLRLQGQSTLDLNDIRYYGFLIRNSAPSSITPP